MDIRNVTQFVNFLEGNGITRMDSSFLQVIQCIQNYTAACSCYKREDKVKIYNMCNGVYHNAVRNVIPRLKHEFLSKISERQISFYNDNGQLIGIISR
jgi:hypothetical protein